MNTLQIIEMNGIIIINTNIPLGEYIHADESDINTTLSGLL